jgi:PAS domain S-box-containing protein
VLSLAAFLAERAAEARELRQAFEFRAEVIAQEVRRQLVQAWQPLRAIEALWSASPEVDEARFAVFASFLLQDRPSLRALEWAPRVRDAERAAFERGHSAGGGGPIREGDVANGFWPAASRPEYYPVAFVRPLAQDEAALRFDLASEPRRRAALEHARDTGEPATTPPLHLVQDPPDAPLRILTFWPIYGNGPTPKTVAERRERLRGFALAVLRPEAILAPALDHAQEGGLQIEVFDGGPSARQPVGGRLAKEGSLDALVARFLGFGGGAVERSIDVGGRTWTMRLRPTARRLLVVTSWRPWAVLALGLLMTMFAAAYVGGLQLRRALRRSNRELSQEIEVRRRAEETVRRSEAETRALLAAVPDVILRFDRRGTFLDVHLPPGYRPPIPRESVLGRRVSEVLPADVAQRAQAEIARVLETHVLRSAEERLTFAGEERTFDARVVPSGPDEVIAVVRDVTDRRRAEARERELERGVQQAQKLESLGVLAGGMAHDFNNLLVAILGNTELALDELPADAPVRESLEQIQLAAKRAADLTQQMLAYSGRGRFAIERVDLNRVVADTTRLLASSVSRRIALETSLAAELPLVDGDPTQLGQVVMNLVLNAAEAIGEAEGRIHVTTETRSVTREQLAASLAAPGVSEGRFVALRVADDGPGMDPGIRGRIFEPFFTTKFAGRGLGLAASLGIVRAHRGALRVDSRPGAGSTFEAWLPIASGAAAVDAAEPAALEAKPRSGVVLVADDEDMVRSLAQRILEGAGYAVIVARDGREALERFAERPQEIVCVLLDSTMPGLGGVEACREIRRLDPDARVLLTSGWGEEEMSRRVSAEGLAGFVRKPYARSELLAAVLRAAALSARED